MPTLAQQAIGDKIGWSRDKVKNHAIIFDQIGTQNLDLAKSVQIGRVPTDGTNVPRGACKKPVYRQHWQPTSRMTKICV